jgi:hypothetical protein
LRARCRTVSCLTMIPRAASNSSTIPNPSGNRKYSQTAWLMISQGTDNRHSGCDQVSSSHRTTQLRALPQAGRLLT